MRRWFARRRDRRRDVALESRGDPRGDAALDPRGHTRLRALDSAAGLVPGAAAGLVLSWAVGAVLLYLPGQSELRRSVQDSAILSRINDSFPPERLLETLERVDPLGVLVGPPATVPPPKAVIARDPDVAAAGGSVVRVSGIACGLGIEGSGWIARRGVVVTNAHVVAGSTARRSIGKGTGSPSRQPSSPSTPRTISRCCS